MTFNVGDIVKKVDGTQKYRVEEVLPESRYRCKLYPSGGIVSFTFKEEELVLAS